MPERVVPVPLFEQAAAELREKGTFQCDLTGQGVAEIMRNVVDFLVSGQDAVRASITEMNVSIEGQQGAVSGAVRVEEPIKATIRVNCVLVNDTVPGRLKSVRLDIIEEAGFVARNLLRAANLKGRAREVFSDPNKALTQVLTTQLKPRGVELTGVELQFKDTALSVSLQGEPIEPIKKR